MSGEMRMASDPPMGTCAACDGFAWLGAGVVRHMDGVCAWVCHACNNRMNEQASRRAAAERWERDLAAALKGLANDCA